MPARAPQIVALGGGGFSMEREGSLLDDYILSLLDAPRPRVCFLPTASGDADHYVVRFYRRFSPVLRGEPRLALPPRPGHRRRRGRPRRTSALAGPDLRRRWQHGEHARRVARTWARLDPAAGMAARDRRVRALGGLAVLVRAGAERLPRRAAPGARARPAAVLQLRALRRGAGAPRGVPPRRRGGHEGRLRRRGRRRPALPRHLPRAGRQLAPRRPGVPRRAARARACARPRWRSTTWVPPGARPGPCAARAPRPGPVADAPSASSRSRHERARRGAAGAGRARGAHDLRDGRRRLHDGAGEPAARRLRALAVARARTAHPVPADGLRRHDAADQRVQSPLPRAHLRPRAPLSVPAARDQAAAARAPRASRTSSTSAAARCATCSRSGARTSSTRC